MIDTSAVYEHNEKEDHKTQYQDGGYGGKRISKLKLQHMIIPS